MDNNRFNAQPQFQPQKPAGGADKRLNIWYGLLLLVLLLFITRLFYLQIIKHDLYKAQALSNQLKQYVIPATRGQILAKEGNQVAPLVLNEKLYTLYADPVYVKDAHAAAAKLGPITSGSSEDYEKAMKKSGTRYVILAKKLNEDQKNQINALKIAGIGTQAQNYRTYPQGTLAAQLLGFVNDDGQGSYGLEQYFDKQLSGTAGQLKAITDVNGVPLAASTDNVQVNPVDGSNIVLTISLAMQQQLETLLKSGLDRVHSTSGSAIIMDPNTGSILAMANYPSYDPAKFYDVKDLSVFANPSVSAPLEVGSIMKTLTVSAGLNEGSITTTTTYQDPGYVTVDGFTIKNVLKNSGTISIQDVLRYSLNTGAVHVLSTLGGGQINDHARNVWHGYMSDHFQLGKLTGIEQPGEAAGLIPDPNNGYSLNLQYANTTFGQGMTATILQMASAFSSAVNGGTYYKPHLVDSTVSSGGGTKVNKPTVVRSNVISDKASGGIRDLLQSVYETNHTLYGVNLHPGFTIGGKTGTSQIPDPNGGYLTNEFNGEYLGFIGGDRPQYVVVVLVNRPPGLADFQSAGSQAAAPIFGSIADMLVNNYNVAPKTH